MEKICCFTMLRLEAIDERDAQLKYATDKIATSGATRKNIH